MYLVEQPTRELQVIALLEGLMGVDDVRFGKDARARLQWLKYESDIA
jgi:hypothetical protein